MSYLRTAAVAEEELDLDDFLRLTFLVSPGVRAAAGSAVGVPRSLLRLMLEKVSCW